MSNSSTTKLVSSSVLSSLILASTLSGCSSMGPPAPKPVRPVLSCADCNGLIYYGPQEGPAPDPRVQLAATIASAATSMTGIIVGGNVATSIASDLSKGVAGAVLVPSNNNTSSTYVEKTSDNNVENTSDVSSTYIERVSDVSSTSVENVSDVSSTVNNSSVTTGP